MDTKKEFIQAAKDYEIIQEFDKIVHDDKRLLAVLAYRSSKKKAEEMKLQSLKQEETEQEKRMHEAAHNVIEKLGKVLKGSDFDLDELDGIDLEIYFH